MTNSDDASATNAIDLMPGAFDVFDARVAEVPADAWGNATPCTEWDVRALVNHVVMEQLWAPRLIAGETVEAVGDAYDGDVIARYFDGDPKRAWREASAKSREAFANVDRGMSVHLSRGPTPVTSYADEMLMDLVVHGWDLARGAGLDERGNPDAVAYELTIAEANRNEWAGYGVFAAPVDTDSEDALERLVAILGRRP
jgi:uncharacterized protein (TIGR03086 family)